MGIRLPARRRIVGIPRCMAYRDGLIYDMPPHTYAVEGDEPLDHAGCETPSGGGAVRDDCDTPRLSHVFVFVIII